MIQTNVNGDILIAYGKGSREDSLKASKELSGEVDFQFLSIASVAETLRSGVKGGELETIGSGKNRKIRSPDKWFLERVLPNTIELDWKDYLTALLSSLEIVVLGKPSRMDFGPRRRGFAQQWTNFLRGYLGEIALKKYFYQKYRTEVELEQIKVGEGIEKYLPTDVTKVKKDGEWRKVKETLSIKTTKLKNMWLAIRGGRLEKSGAFALVKIGIPENHLAIFLKKIRALENLFDCLEGMPGIEEEFKTEEILEEIQDFNPLPAYLPGFCWKEDFESSELESEAKQKHIHATGGMGRVSSLPSPPKENGEIKVRGFGRKPAEDCLAATGSLRWTEEEWSNLLESM